MPAKIVDILNLIEKNKGTSLVLGTITSIIVSIIYFLISESSKDAIKETIERVSKNFLREFLKKYLPVQYLCLPDDERFAALKGLVMQNEAPRPSRARDDRADQADLLLGFIKTNIYNWDKQQGYLNGKKVSLKLDIKQDDSFFIETPFRQENIFKYNFTRVGKREFPKDSVEITITMTSGLMAFVENSMNNVDFPLENGSSASYLSLLLAVNIMQVHKQIYEQDPYFLAIYLPLIIYLQIKISEQDIRGWDIDFTNAGAFFKSVFAGILKDKISQRVANTCLALDGDVQIAIPDESLNDMIWEMVQSA